jgi:hypothetical protein
MLVRAIHSDSTALRFFFFFFFDPEKMLYARTKGVAKGVARQNVEVDTRSTQSTNGTV